ncbi:hypothetical protein COL154_008614 [Colletotrichum chrysophilum]|nr:hypothetical protein KNSL1_011502 [Colletotrichum chrysophilum]KAJ0359064.1 hypothetical protein COL154_008614 [Colletotrichum chrysophilum]
MVEGRGQDQDAPGSSMEPELRYVVPRWFLDNLKTADELKNAQAKIWLVDETTDAVKDSSMADETTDENLLPGSAGNKPDGYFSVAHEAMEDLLDATASLQMVDLAGRLSVSQSSITLSCEMRFGLQFLDELVVLVAQELDSSLISINLQDLEDIGLDFYYQKKAYDRRYQGEDQTDHGSASYNHNDDDFDASDNESDASEGSYDTSNIAQKAAQRYFGFWANSLSEAETKYFTEWFGTKDGLDDSLSP